MKRLRIWIPFAILAILLAGAFTTLPGGVVFAQEHETKAEAQEDPVEAPIGTLFKWLNFLVVFGALGYFIAKKTPPIFRARAEAIAAGITSATAAKAEAEQQLRKAEAGLAKLDEEAAAMREALKKEFADEAARLAEAGKKELEKIEHAAEVEGNAARRVARLELRALVARLATEQAAELLPQQITMAQRAALVQRFVEGLPTATSGSGGVN
jgi:F0F1-type ATP synthase membrane subunit b/b'